MTRDEIMAMQPGRELDALVAEKVMGWQPRSKKWGGEWDEYEDFWHDGKNFVYECAMFTPSFDISAAWEVVEKMKKKNWWSVVSSEADKWNAMFYWDPHKEAFEAESNTAPEAICKAALLTVMEVSE